MEYEKCRVLGSGGGVFVYEVNFAGDGPFFEELRHFSRDDIAHLFGIQVLKFLDNP